MKEMMLKPRLTGTPWENFREFLLKMRDEYEEIAKTGTVEFGEEAQANSGEKKLKCDFCKRRGHTDSDCWQKKSGGGKSDGKTEGKRTCYKCQGDDHIARDCPQKVKNSSNLVKQKKQEQKKQEVRDNTEQELFYALEKTNRERFVVLRVVRRDTILHFTLRLRVQYKLCR
jgi:hypothetical protein